MLNVTILKVKHETEKDAQKLLTHIQKCDIFAPEHQGGTLKEAVAQEGEWLRLLKLSRSALHQTIEERGRLNGTPPNPYKIKETDYLFRSEKPVVFIERFSEEESQQILGLAKASDKLWDSAMIKLLDAEIARSIMLAISSAAVSALEIRLRDEHIAKNLESMEGYIRDKNPVLTEKEVIGLAIALGSKHSPERYSRIPIQTELLIDQNPYEFIQLSENARDYLPRDVLAFILAQALLATGIKPDQDKFRSAPIEELEKILIANQSFLKAKMLKRK